MKFLKNLVVNWLKRELELKTLKDEVIENSRKTRLLEERFDKIDGMAKRNGRLFS